MYLRPRDSADERMLLALDSALSNFSLAALFVSFTILDTAVLALASRC
ncbi:unannotated protein [freshwater metagenome]|uniref:Unannotated protein n=1 Tax=freshwater metagenome TaxID=449393 RepID=A0A6J6HIM9_9ZZZZ